MPIGRYLRETTRRQHLAWIEHLRARMSEPDKTEWYLMQLASLLVWTKAERGQPPDIGKMRIAFAGAGGEVKEVDHPFPAYTRESAAKVRLAIAKHNMTKNDKVRGL